MTPKLRPSFVASAGALDRCSGGEIVRHVVSFITDTFPSPQRRLWGDISSDFRPGDV